MDSKSFVTVASFEISVNAWIYRNRLATDGLTAFVVDEHVVDMHWLHSGAIGGVKVQIPRSQVGKYRSLIENQSKETKDPLVFIDFEDLKEPLGDVCPKCQSMEFLRAGYAKRIIFLIWLVLGFPIPITGGKAICSSCGFEERLAYKLTYSFTLLLILLAAMVFLVAGGFHFGLVD